MVSVTLPTIDSDESVKGRLLLAGGREFNSRSCQSNDLQNVCLSLPTLVGIIIGSVRTGWFGVRVMRLSWISDQVLALMAWSMSGVAL